MMDEMKWSLEAIRIQRELTRQEFAEQMRISTDRYNRLVTGESKMLACELITISRISGIPMENIEVKA